ncbi:IQ domain-containing protein K [Neodiprion pinetum]|uniref:IQ domain-containing protein K n=1 Tax=Neodiprion pinetum TaxID=441929 RepID=UPI001EDE8A57|nr:IQ domain-containing protein K-like [Neodiprion pinetum]
MCQNSQLFSFFTPSPAELRSLSCDEDEQDDKECICGPNPCGFDSKSSKDSSLDSDDEVEVVNVSLWESILRQSEEKTAPYREWIKERNASEPAGKPQDSPADFLDQKIFPLLLPAMRTMLMQAQEWDALCIQKCRFNGLDFLAEILWNSNPRHPRRLQNWLEVFSIPPFRLWLKSNPRPIFPKSWLWTQEDGALIIQKWVRGWLVRKQEDVQEMRLFWKVLPAMGNFVYKNLENQIFQQF